MLRSYHSFRLLESNFDLENMSTSELRKLLKELESAAKPAKEDLMQIKQEIDKLTRRKEEIEITIRRLYTTKINNIKFELGKRKDHETIGHKFYSAEEVWDEMAKDFHFVKKKPEDFQTAQNGYENNPYTHPDYATTTDETLREIIYYFNTSSKSTSEFAFTIKWDTENMAPEFYSYKPASSINMFKKMLKEKGYIIRNIPRQDNFLIIGKK